MIQLSADFTKWLYVDTAHNSLVLHVKNEADEYFTYTRILDKAMSLDEHLMAVEQKDFSEYRAYTLDDKLEHAFVIPHDQHWAPVPVPGADVVSLAQYRTLKGLPDAA